MKKILLFVCILSWSYHAKAQCDSTLPISENFSDITAVNFCWDFIDADRDGNGWNVVDLGGGNNGLQSASWTPATGPLSPDNWVITNVIDLTGYSPSNTITLSWRVITPDWSFDKENYAVYVATGNQISNFTSSPIMFTENLDNSNASGTWASRSFNISALAGQMVYVAFRHYNVTDQNVIDIDNVSISSSGSSGGCTDSDGDGVCDSVDQCPGFDDRIDSNGNGIPDGCESSTCNEKSANFAENPLTHSGTGTNTTTITLPSGSQNISFTINGIDEKTNGKESDKYIESVKVTYKDAAGITKSNGIYRGDQVSGATINIPDNAQSITLELNDAYDGNYDNTLSVTLSPVTYCASASPCTDSDGDGVCDADDKCPGFDDTIDINGNGIPDGCESTCAENTDPFSENPLTHSGSGSNSTTLNFPTNSQDASFTISGLGQKTKGRQGSLYIETVVVTYVDGANVSKTYGTFNGSNVSSATINITGKVKSITVSLSNFSGSTSSTLSINLSPVTYCISSSSSQVNSSSKEGGVLNNVVNSNFSESMESAFKIYPNPASRALFVKTSGLNDSKANISLYNMNGVRIRSYDLNSKFSQTNELDIDGIATGMYILHIKSENGSLLKTERIIIN